MIKPKRAIQKMQAYHAPREGRRAFVRLDFNENTTGFREAGPPGLPLEQVMVYPEYQVFTEKLAALWGLEPAQILLTNGSDEGLFIIPLAFVEPEEDVALIPSPTFALIPQYLAVAQAKVLEVPVRPDMAYDLPALEAALEAGVRLAILPSPDNPTGATLDAGTVEAWCHRFPETLFVLDEAYAEYADVSVMHLVGRLENLLVTRTFSKAWGLAGLRLGVVVGPSSLLDALRCVRPPYSVNSAAVWAAERMLEHVDRVRSEALATVVRKRALIEALDQHGFEVTRGGGNFFLLSAGIDAQRLCDYCRTRDVLIRNRSIGRAPGDHPLWGRIRVSAGTEGENQRLIEALEAFREHQALVFDLDDALIDAGDGRKEAAPGLLEQLGLRFRLFLVSRRARLEQPPVRGRAGASQDLENLVSRGDAETRSSEGSEIDRLRGSRRPAGAPRANEPGLEVGADLELYFEEVYWLDELADQLEGLSADVLRAILETPGITAGYFVGSSVDGLRSASAAGLVPIGVGPAASEAQLREAGAAHVVDSLRALEALFQLSDASSRAGSGAGEHG